VDAHAAPRHIESKYALTVRLDIDEPVRTIVEALAAGVVGTSSEPMSLSPVLLPVAVPAVAEFSRKPLAFTRNSRTLTVGTPNRSLLRAEYES